MTTRAILVDILEPSGRVARRERFGLPYGTATATIGRGIGADIVLDDPHVALLHAAMTIEPDGRITLTDRGSVNGIIAGGRRHRSVDPITLAGDSTFQIGRTRIRVRTSDADLPPERPDSLGQAMRVSEPSFAALLGLVIGGAQIAYTSWLGAPRDLTDAVAWGLLYAIAAATAWIAVWSLLTRIMRGEWRWVRHAAIALVAAAVYKFADGGIDLARFTFGLPGWTAQGYWLTLLAVAGALYLHLRAASGLGARAAALVAVVLPLMIGGGQEWLAARALRTNVNMIASNVRLYPPALRVSPAQSLQATLTSAAALRDEAERKRLVMKAQDPVDGEF